MPLIFSDALVYAASYLDGLDQGLGSGTTVELDLDEDVLAAASRCGVDVETFMLAAVVIGMRQ